MVFVPSILRSLTASTIMVLLVGCSSVSNTKPDMSFIQNSKIKLGIDLDMGGSITYISKAGSSLNLVNSADLGRQIQMSHYSYPVPFEPDGKKADPTWTGIGWNPIQSGDVAGNKSKVLAYKNDGKSIYVKCIPMHWPLTNVPGECTFECWITLKDNTVQVKSRMVNNRPDTNFYPARGQELPAVYTNGPWWRLMTYIGDKPYTGGELTQTPAAFLWKIVTPTENWSALVNNEGWGLGIYEPGVYTIAGGFAGKPGKGGPKDGPTGYIAPEMDQILDHNIDTAYQYVLILGTVKEIRDYVYKQPRPATQPQWVFDKDRYYWTYGNAIDTGWPIKGELDVDLSKSDASINGPKIFIQADKNPVLYIKAAFKTEQKQMTLVWEKQRWSEIIDMGQADPCEMYTTTFPVTGDGEYRVYAIELKGKPNWSGVISRLRIISPVGADGQRVQIKSIGFKRPSGE